MARVMTWGLLIVMGAGGMFLYQRFTRTNVGGSTSSSPVAPTGGGELDAVPPPSPIFVLGEGPLPEGELSIPRGELVPPPAREDLPPAEPGVGASEAGVEKVTADEDETFEAILARYRTPTAEDDVLVLGGEQALGVAEGVAEPEIDKAPNPLVGADRTEFQEAFDKAARAFGANDVEEGLRIYRQIFEAGHDRDDLRVTVVARRLLQEEDGELDGESLACHRYLARHEVEPARRYRSALAAGLALVDSKKAGEVRTAWELLSKAYLAASTADERAVVLDALEPFVQRNVFTRRASPLLFQYRVKQGDSLEVIARDHQTTPDAIRRLNDLPNDIIRVGQRLTILSGSAAIYINKREFRLALFINGRLLFEKPIGIGSDDSTPEGRFVVTERQKHPAWYRPGEPPIPPGDPRNILGTRWLGFEDTETATGIGIHGTPDETSIGKALSSGCIRLTNANVEELFDFVPRRTRVIIES